MYGLLTRWICAGATMGTLDSVSGTEGGTWVGTVSVRRGQSANEKEAVVM